MESGKTPRVEDLESGQQEMQEKIARMTKMVADPTKEKGITDDPNYKESLHLGKVALIHPLSQIRTTFVNKEIRTTLVNKED